jgi:signal peptidase I
MSLMKVYLRILLFILYVTDEGLAKIIIVRDTCFIWQSWWKVYDPVSWYYRVSCFQEGQKYKQISTNHTHKTKDLVTRTPLKTGDVLRYSGSGTRRVNLVKHLSLVDLRNGNNFHKNVCSSDWHLFEGNCYFFGVSWLSWTGAQVYFAYICFSQSMHIYMVEKTH